MRRIVRGSSRGRCDRESYCGVKGNGEHIFAWRLSLFLMHFLAVVSGLAGSTIRGWGWGFSMTASFASVIAIIILLQSQTDR